MLIQKFATMFQSIVFALLGWINLPKLDEDTLSDMVSFFADMADTGAGLVLFFISDYTLKIALGVTIALAVFKYGYYLVMWILKKIPVAGVS